MRAEGVLHTWNVSRAAPLTAKKRLGVSGGRHGSQLRARTRVVDQACLLRVQRLAQASKQRACISCATVETGHSILLLPKLPLQRSEGLLKGEHETLDFGAQVLLVNDRLRRMRVSIHAEKQSCTASAHLFAEECLDARLAGCVRLFRCVVLVRCIASKQRDLTCDARDSA